MHGCEVGARAIGLKRCPRCKSIIHKWGLNFFFPLDARPVLHQHLERRVLGCKPHLKPPFLAHSEKGERCVRWYLDLSMALEVLPLHEGWLPDQLCVEGNLRHVLGPMVERRTCGQVGRWAGQVGRWGDGENVGSMQRRRGAALCNHAPCARVHVCMCVCVRGGGDCLNSFGGGGY